MKYPLSILRIEIAFKDGVWVGDPNSVIMQIIKNRKYFMNLTPMDSGFNCVKREYVPIESVISKKPAVVYRACDYEIPLDPLELDRFLRRDLNPEEFFILFNIYGNLHEIHEDFYDHDTGESMQPLTS